MVNHVLDATFAALSSSTRRAILARLVQGEASITELAEPFDMSLPAVLKHLDVLETAGLVEGKKEGRVRRCRLSPRPLQEAGRWIGNDRRFWETQFDSLDRHLETSKPKETRR